MLLLVATQYDKCGWVFFELHLGCTWVALVALRLRWLLDFRLLLLLFRSMLVWVDFFRSHFLAVANEAVRGILLAAGLLDWFGFLRGTATGNWNSEFRLLITGTL